MGFEANPIILLIMLSLVSRRAATGNPRPFWRISCKFVWWRSHYNHWRLATSW
jgi:hypothetical protein